MLCFFEKRNLEKKKKEKAKERAKVREKGKTQGTKGVRMVEMTPKVVFKASKNFLFVPNFAHTTYFGLETHHFLDEKLLRVSFRTFDGSKSTTRVCRIFGEKGGLQVRFLLFSFH